MNYVIEFKDYKTEASLQSLKNSEELPPFQLNDDIVIGNKNYQIVQRQWLVYSGTSDPELSFLFLYVKEI